MPVPAGGSTAAKDVAFVHGLKQVLNKATWCASREEEGSTTTHSDPLTPPHAPIIAPVVVLTPVPFHLLLLRQHRASERDIVLISGTDIVL